MFIKKKLSLLNYEIISTIFICIVGTLLHFTFEIANKSLIVAPFSAINESTWEHLKILFMPMFITTLFGYFYFKKDYSNYGYIKTKGILLAMLFIVIFFYTYQGVLGFNSGFLNIASFYIAIILEEIYAYQRIIKGEKGKKFGLILGLIFGLFILFTFFPLDLGIFIDPISNSYGIQK